MAKAISKRTRTAFVAGSLALASVVGVAVPADAASASFSTWTYKGAAYAQGTVYSGQARLRADCKYAPDVYSNWVGRGYHSLLATPKCPWGIRGAIMELRY